MSGARRVGLDWVVVSGLLSLGAAWGGFIASSARAETIVSQRIKATRRLIPPTKLTVGPDDQYNGSVDASGKFLVFTHKSDLVPHLVIQELGTGQVSDLLPLTADSQESSLGPEGKVAFAYYKYNARGDICWSELPRSIAQGLIEEGHIHCLKAPEGEAQAEHSSPFWLSSQEIGYVVRDLSAQSSQIEVQDIRSGVRRSLVQGKVWSPTMRPGGRYLVYSSLERSPAQRVLKLKDLSSGQEKTLRFALPGISGFPSISEDEKYLYFSHYMDDTNHDNVIDGSDNSVVFRAPVAALWAQPEGKDFLPEQLTSIEDNCSFPRPSGESVYVSCALEGALDVYRIAATGIVPADWDAKILANAHQTSRTYAERILLLNTMKYRLGDAHADLDARLLGDHVLADDTTAARFYIERLQAEASPEQRDFYRLLSLYLEAREKKKSQPSVEVSREFRDKILALDGRVGAVRGQPRFQKIVRGLLRSFLEQPKEALSFLKQISFSGKQDRIQPMERYLSFELASWTLSRTQPENKVTAALVGAYREMAAAPELGEEGQLYYAFNLLKLLQSEDGDEAFEPKELDKRIAAIRALNHGMPPAVDRLLRSEAAVLEVIRARDDDAKAKAYEPLDELMSKSRDDYFLRKALYVRAVLCFTEAGEFKYNDFVASNWLRYTASGDTEFIHAREFFSTAELDHAYESWGKKNFQLASGYFYGSLSLTDDLESHAGYLHSMVARGQRSTIDDRYKNLVSRQFVEDNMKFVRALLILIDSQPAAQADPAGVQHLNRALAELSAMEQDRDSPVRYLLLGHCYLDKLLRTSSGLEVDADLLREAHRTLMLAYDLGRDNDRIKAATLLNLAVLHQRAQNHGLAAKFFALRKPLGFVSSEEEGAFAFLYARSLYYTHEPEKAADELAHAPGNVPLNYVGPLIEREAFYRVNAGQYGQAAELYAKLLQRGLVQGHESLAKVNLNYGLALFKLKRETQARDVLRGALEHTAALTSVPRDRDRWVDFDPLRLKLAIYGLLSRLGSDVDRLQALDKRAALLPEAKKMFDTSYLPTVIENRLTAASVASRAQPDLAGTRLKEGLQFAEELGDSDLGYLSNAVYRAATQYLAHGWLHPQGYEHESPERIRKVVGQCLAAYDKQKGVQPMLAYQRIKLEILWAAFSGKVLKHAEAAPDLKSVAQTEAGREIQVSLPGQWKELLALRAATAQ